MNKFIIGFIYFIVFIIVFSLRLSAQPKTGVFTPRQLQIIDSLGNRIDVSDSLFALNNIIYAVDYGVVPDGLTDNTGALQNAVDAVGSQGILVLPIGTIRINGTVYVNPDSQYAGIGIIGTSQIESIIEYRGNTDSATLWMERPSRFSLSNFSIINGNTSGTGIGIRVYDNVAEQSNAGPAILNKLFISNFNKGIYVGSTINANAASEFSYQNVEVSGNVKGILLEGANSLNHNFYNLFGAFNGTTLEAADPDCINIYGGSCSNDTVQNFAFRQSGVYAIYGFRSEGSESFIVFGGDETAGAGSSTEAIISGCRIASTLRSDSAAIRLNKAGNYTIIDNQIHGNISMHTGETIYANVNIFNNRISNDTLITFTLGDKYTHVIAEGNVNASTSEIGQYFPDENYIKFYNTTTSTQDRIDYAFIDLDNLTTSKIRLGNQRVEPDSLANDVYTSKLALYNQALQGDSCNSDYDYLNHCDTTLHANWHFDEGSGVTAYDYSGNGNDMSTIGAWSSEVKIGASARELDGNAAIFDEGNAVSLTNGSVACWLYLNNTTSGMILEKGNLSTYLPVFSVSHSLGKPEIRLGNLSDYTLLASTTTLSTSTWYFLAFTWDSLSRSIYINGVLDTTNTHNIGAIDLSGYQWKSGYNVYGSLDEMRVWNRTLTATEILNLYNTELSGSPPEYKTVNDLYDSLAYHREEFDTLKSKTSILDLDGDITGADTISANVFIASGSFNANGSGTYKVDGDVVIDASKNVINVNNGSFGGYITSGSYISASDSIIVGGTKLTVPDYVFGESYKQNTIREMEAFYKKNKHLPTIPSERELKATPINILRFNMQLLETIEVQAKYLVELEKRITKLEGKK